MEKNTKRLERRARVLLLSKDIPPGKMDIVRSLMNNRDLNAEERYSAIIALIKSCPDKVIKIQKEDRVEVKRAPVREQIPGAGEKPGEKKPLGPEESGVFVDRVYRKYRSMGLFKKRYLIHSSNKLGLGFKKRLIPTKKLMRVFGDIVRFKEQVLERLPDITAAVLNDESIDDPTLFNYLMEFRKWMMETPIVRYQYSTIKWMDRSNFESEFKNFVVGFFSFQKLGGETRERLVSLVESKLRDIQDLRQEIINQVDPDHVRGEKEKRNLEKEKKVFEYIKLLRSFLPHGREAGSVVSSGLSERHGVDTFPQLLVMVMEALVFRRETGMRDLEVYYAIKPPAVSTAEWDFPLAELKKAGKDPETRRKRRLDNLRSRLAPYDELHALLELRMDGHDILMLAFEDQWKVVDKKQKDFDAVYEDDFYTFLDGCVNFFSNCFVPLIDGGLLYFEDPDRVPQEGGVFSPGYFTGELNELSRLLGEMYYFRSNNPSVILKRKDIKNIVTGNMSTPERVERIIIAAGNLFYGLGMELWKINRMHALWASGTLRGNRALLRQALSREEAAGAEDTGRPIPYSDCRITGFERNRSLSRVLTGRRLFDDSSLGVILHAAAFSSQLAYECVNEDIHHDLDQRKGIIREIRELSENRR